MSIRILTPKIIPTDDYPKATEFTKMQNDILWFFDEIDVEKDVHDLKTNFTEAEYYGVISTLKLFTQYEISVGEYWRDYVAQVFPRTDIQKMAAMFSYVELCTHGPFYKKINELLGLDTDEFFTEYKQDPILSNRMSWIGKRIEKRETLTDKLKSVGCFSMIEGAILYGAFAYLKHFNSVGKNKIVNINAGLNFSANDEQIHSLAGAWLFRTLLEEAIQDTSISQDEIEHVKSELIETARIIFEHESIIIDKIFENGLMKGVTEKQLKHFVESRLDLCLQNLGLTAIFKPSYNPIAKWFYLDLESSVLHDFFSSQGSDYNRAWIETRFKW